MSAGISPRIRYVVPPEIFPRIHLGILFRIRPAIMLGLPLEFFAGIPPNILDEVHFSRNSSRESRDTRSSLVIP